MSVLSYTRAYIHMYKRKLSEEKFYYEITKIFGQNFKYILKGNRKQLKMC